MNNADICTYNHCDQLLEFIDSINKLFFSSSSYHRLCFKVNISPAYHSRKIIISFFLFVCASAYVSLCFLLNVCIMRKSFQQKYFIGFVLLFLVIIKKFTSTIFQRFFFFLFLFSLVVRHIFVLIFPCLFQKKVYPL